MPWLIYTRGTVPPYRLALFLQGFKEGYIKNQEYDYFNLLVSNEGEKLWFAWYEEDVLKYGNIIIKKCQSKKSFQAHFNKIKNCAAESIRLSQKTDIKNLKSYNNIEFAQFFNQVWHSFVRANTFLGFDIDIFDIGFGKFLYQEFKKEFKGGEKEAQEVFHTLSSPACKTYVQAEESALMKIALQKKVTPKDIREAHQRFWWTSLGWESIAPKSEKYFENEIKRLQQKSRAKLQADLEHLDNHIARIKIKRTKLLKEYKLSQKFADLLVVTDKYTFLHDKRKEMQVKNIHTIYFLLNEFCRRTGYRVSDLEWLWANEVLSLFSGQKLDKKLIAKRRKCILALVKKRKYTEISGQAGINLRKKELAIRLDNSGIIKGQIAQKGKARGTAKVCNGAEEALRKVKTGDILVCGMTLPEYVPAMKRAAAIVTDEGGITSHAAIISRELKIPCIIGTKIATQVLHDGDLVEVDADKGVVKKIKK